MKVMQRTRPEPLINADAPPVRANTGPAPTPWPTPSRTSMLRVWSPAQRFRHPLGISDESESLGGGPSCIYCNKFSGDSDAWTRVTAGTAATTLPPAPWVPDHGLPHSGPLVTIYLRNSSVANSPPALDLLPASWECDEQDSLSEGRTAELSPCNVVVEKRGLLSPRLCGRVGTSLLQCPSANADGAVTWTNPFSNALVFSF